MVTIDCRFFFPTTIVIFVGNKTKHEALTGSPLHAKPKLPYKRAYCKPFKQPSQCNTGLFPASTWIMPSVPMNFSTVCLEQGRLRKVIDWKCFRHACRLHFKTEWSCSNLKTCGYFKGIVLPQIIFHPFTTHHFLDSGSGYFLIYITIL